MVTLDQRVEAMMVLANKNRRRADGRPSPGRGGAQNRDSYPGSNPETGDSPGSRDCDSLLRTASRKDRRRDSEDQDDNCLLRCGRCLAQVPCATMCCWVFMATAVAISTGGVLVAAIKGQDMFGKDQQKVSLVTWICIGVLFSMVFLGTVFLIVACLSTGKMSRRVFNSRKKNVCARVLNGTMMVIMIFLQFIWILATAILALPVAILGFLHYLFYVQHVPCVNLQYYGLSRSEHLVCHRELELMMHRSSPVLIAVCMALAGAMLTVKSMTFFILCASSNMMFLKESRFASYNVHQNGKRGSFSSQQDTKM